MLTTLTSMTTLPSPTNGAGVLYVAAILVAAMFLPPRGRK